MAKLGRDELQWLYCIILEDHPIDSSVEIPELMWVKECTSDQIATETLVAGRRMLREEFQAECGMKHGIGKHGGWVAFSECGDSLNK